jgi:hypothetical protein
VLSSSPTRHAHRRRTKAPDRRRTRAPGAWAAQLVAASCSFPIDLAQCSEVSNTTKPKPGFTVAK